VNQYSIELERNNKKLTLAVQSNDTAHVQAQAVDICRAVDATQYLISYEHIDESPLAKLFRDLAFNNFDYKECFEWEGSFCNKTAVLLRIRKTNIRPLFDSSIFRYP
jgi:hypothetical protein